MNIKKLVSSYGIEIAVIICVLVVIVVAINQSQQKEMSRREALEEAWVVQQVEELEPLFDPGKKDIAIFKLHGSSEYLLLHKQEIKNKIDAWAKEHSFLPASITHQSDPSFNSVTWTFTLARR